MMPTILNTNCGQSDEVTANRKPTILKTIHHSHILINVCLMHGKY